MCPDTASCRKEFKGSTCDVEGWNCNCGWEHASSLLAGDQNENAKCMGTLYYASDYVCSHMKLVMLWMWKPILFFMAVTVFLGEKQVRCECHDPKRFKLTRNVWKFFKARAGRPVPPPACQGTCVTRARWEWQDWSYEHSWSIYIFDLGLWAYAFVLVVFLTGLVAGSILAILALVLVAILAAFSALIMFICGGDGGGDIGCQDCACHELCGASGDCPCCDGCLTGGLPAPYSSPATDFLLWGPQPAGSSCDDCTCRCCGDGRCDCCPRFWLCRPLTWVLVQFPEMPSNMWGGWLGRLMGTHHFTREGRRYQGGKWWINKLSFRTAADLHQDSRWRQRVFDFVFSDPDPAPPQMQMPPSTGQGRQQQQPARRPTRTHRQGRNGNVDIKRRDPFDPFTVEHDNCQSSTFEDYKERKCWICCDDTRDTFHMWVQCGHIFCSMCSDAMMQRSMPCPLCRQVSTMIVEAPRWKEPYAPPTIVADAAAIGGGGGGGELPKSPVPPPGNPAQFQSAAPSQGTSSAQRQSRFTTPGG